MIGGVLLAMLMIMTVSRAAFTDAASNDGNSWTTGSVAIHDANVANDPVAEDESAAALFATSTNIAPGYDEDHCIDVVYDGSLDASALLTSVTAAGDMGLAAALTLEVNRYVGAGCSGTATLVAGGTLGTPTISETAWPATGGIPGGDVYSYNIRVQLPSTVIDNTLQGKMVTADFQWTATSI